MTGKKIDDTIAENKEFLENRDDKVGKKNIEIIVKPPPATKKEREDFDRKIKEADRRTQLNSKIKELEISKTTEEIEILRAKREKLEAFLIPVDIVKQIFAQHSKSITVSFQQGGENLLIEVSKKKS